MLRIFWPNAASTSTRPRAADAVGGHGGALAPPSRAGVLQVALLACVLGLPALPSVAAEPAAKRPHATKAVAKPAAPTRTATPATATPATATPAATPATAPAGAAAPGGPLLQLGIYSGDGDAWLSWKNLQQRARDLTAGLTASVMPLDGKSGAGVALYAQVVNLFNSPIQRFVIAASEIAKKKAAAPAA